MYEINLKVTSLYTSLQGLYCKIVYSYLEYNCYYNYLCTHI